MQRAHKYGLGAFVLLMGASLLAMRPETAQQDEAQKVAQANLKFAAVSTAARRDVDYALLDQRLQQLMTKPAMVGLAVGVVENGRITFLRGYGETLEGSGQPVTPETVFRWASISKGVAGTMVTKLAQQGKVQLDAPVVNYAPGLKLPAQAEYSATVGHLLSHRVGLYRNAYDNKLEEGMDPHILRQSLGQLNLTCAPGTCWSYQNIAFDASSDIVADATGQTYEQAVKQHLFNPIGMTSASMSLPALTANRSWARPHGTGGRELRLVDTYYKVPAAGGVNSNIKDLTLWMVAQMGEMPAVLDPQLLKIIHAPYVKTPGERMRLRKFLERIKTAWYGYGWRSYNYAGHRVIGHRGGINGYRALIMFDPQKKSGVVALWNSNTNQPGGLEFEVMDMVYRLPFRDWLELDSRAPRSPGQVVAANAETESESGNGDAAGGGGRRASR
ncbi:serine hydrolase domain-containing protein [Sphingomonas lutea]|nr:serine hydrolase domain-containing protein [Sphingomonas lutea]